jgi:hypothetical protein
LADNGTERVNCFSSPTHFPFSHRYMASSANRFINFGLTKVKYRLNKTH